MITKFTYTFYTCVLCQQINIYVGILKSKNIKNFLIIIKLFININYFLFTHYFLLSLHRKNFNWYMYKNEGK